MTEKINDKTLEYIGALAKIELKEEEKVRARLDMEKMLDYADKLNELDTDGVEPLVQVVATENVFREDIVTNSDDRENMLFNAPEKKDGQYMVPKTFN